MRYYYCGPRFETQCRLRGGDSRDYSVFFRVVPFANLVPLTLISQGNVLVKEPIGSERSAVDGIF